MFKLLFCSTPLVIPDFLAIVLKALVFITVSKIFFKRANS